MPDVHDKWVAASTYEDFMGRWSRQLAPRFVSWLRIPAGSHWLDVGCGTGALTSAICAHAGPASVVGCDPVPAFVEFARENLEDTRASFVIGGSGGLPRRAGGYDCVSSLCALNFFPDAPAAVREMQILAAHHGKISACVWDYGGKMEFLRLFWDAAVGLDQDARQLDEGVRFPLCQPDALMELFSTCGLHKVRCEALEIPTEFASFDDYWRPLLGGTGPAPSYVASIDDERRAALARKLEQVIPRSAEGRILLTARAWALEGLTD